jgi:hypothetical protein
MLEIIINREPVDIPDNVQIALTIENPFMLQDRTPTPYSLNFDLNPTPRNLRLFKYPNRITAKSVYTELDCVIRFRSVNIATGVIKLNNFDQTLKVNFKGVSIADTLRKNLYEQSLRSYQFGQGNTPPSPIDFTTGPGKDYADLWLDAKNYPAAYPFAIGPVRYANGEWYLWERSARPGSPPAVLKGMPDISSAAMYFNYFVPTTGKWMLEDGDDRFHSPIYPFPYVHYMFDAIFGETLRYNPFKTGDLSKLVTFASYHPNWRGAQYQTRLRMNGMQVDTKPDVAQYPFHVYLETRLPKMGANDYVREMLKIICGTLFSRRGKWEVQLNDTILASNAVDDWEAKLINNLTSTLQNKQAYNYGYADDNSDDTTTADQTVTSVQAIYDQTLTEGGSRDYYVSTTGERYNKSIEDGQAYITPLTYNFGKYNSEDSDENKFDMNPSIVPLPMTIDYFWDVKNLPTGTNTPDNMYFWHVPSYGGDRLVRPEQVNVLLFHGMKQGFRPEDSYPFLSPYNYDLKGNKIASFNLRWEGEEGLLNTYHQRYRDWVEKDKMKISGTFLLSPLDLHQLDLSKKKYVKGRHFFVEKISLTIRKNRIDPAQVDLLEA